MTRREREVTDPAAILGILDRAKIVHVGMVDNGEPYIVPMNYGYTMENGKLTLYLHGAKEGRKLDILRVNPKVFVEIDTDLVPFEGKTACHYGIGYSSIMGRGIAELVEDTEGKKKGLSVLMKTQTGKDFEFDDRMVSVVTVIKITVSDYTAKHRPVPQKG
ncbi:MAG: pyridoxamine 5'-phosphate oxidase family protein [Clostridia bacterium]|nr:pyridoxamine 5'-phosphate oxidase family protein [Clostridia bacterium]